MPPGGKTWSVLEDPPEYPLANVWRRMRVDKVIYLYLLQGRARLQTYMTYNLDSPLTWPEESLTQLQVERTQSRPRDEPQVAGRDRALQLRQAESGDRGAVWAERRRLGRADLGVPPEGDGIATLEQLAIDYGTMQGHLGVQLDVMGHVLGQITTSPAGEHQLEELVELAQRCFAAHLTWSAKLLEAAAPRAATGFDRSVMMLTGAFLRSESDAD